MGSPRTDGPCCCELRIGMTLDCVSTAKIDKLLVSTQESTDRRTQCESCGRRFHFTRMEAGVQTEADGNYSFSLVLLSPGPDYFLRFHQNFNHPVYNWRSRHQPVFIFNTNNNSERRRDNESDTYDLPQSRWRVSPKVYVKTKGCTKKL